MKHIELRKLVQKILKEESQNISDGHINQWSRDGNYHIGGDRMRDPRTEQFYTALDAVHEIDDSLDIAVRSFYQGGAHTEEELKKAIPILDKYVNEEPNQHDWKVSWAKALSKAFKKRLGMPDDTANESVNKTKISEIRKLVQKILKEEFKKK